MEGDNKLKIAYCSDLHFEHYNESWWQYMIESYMVDPYTELIIIAGDIAVGAFNVSKILTMMYNTYKIPIIYIPGNHEYYHGTIEDFNKEINDYFSSNDEDIIILNDLSYCYKNIVFCGGVGFIDESYEPLNKLLYHKYADTKYIKNYGDCVKYGERTKLYFESVIKNTKPSYHLVCISHFLPSSRCIHPYYQNNVLNSFFVNNWNELFYYDNSPDVWICGHTHIPFELEINKTKVYCNPHGYPHERHHTLWDWKYIIIGDM